MHFPSKVSLRAEPNRDGKSFNSYDLVITDPLCQYWGWCKYRYRETPKKTFAKAKKLALEKLNSCPVAVLRRFINCSWQFMSAYHLGLTGKAAIWAVRRQKQHHKVSQSAMMSINAVLNTQTCNANPQHRVQMLIFELKILAISKVMGNFNQRCFQTFFASLKPNLSSVLP